MTTFQTKSPIPGNTAHAGIFRKEATNAVVNSGSEHAPFFAPALGQPAAATSSSFFSAAPATIQRQCGDCADEQQLQRLENATEQSGDEDLIMRQAVPETPPAISTAPATPATIPTSMPCAPQGLSRHDFLSRNGNNTGEFGHTALSASSGMLRPSFLFFHSVGRGRIKPLPIQVTLPAIDSIYTDTGVFDEGSQRVHFGSVGPCLTDDYPMRWVITADGAAKIREAEEEHCNDYNHAYTSTVLPYVNLVNRLAAGRRTFVSERSARQHIERQLRFNPDDWFSRFGCMLQQSVSLRDLVARGFTRSSHEPIPSTTAPNEHNHCAYSRITISARSLPQVGQIPSSDVEAGC